MLLATGKQSADADKRVCDKNNSLSKASSQEYPKYQYPFLLDIVFLQSAFYCPFIVKKQNTILWNIGFNLTFTNLWSLHLYRFSYHLDLLLEQEFLKVLKISCREAHP